MPTSPFGGSRDRARGEAARAPFVRPLDRLRGAAADHIWLIAVLAFQVAFLRPVLRTTWLSDDALHFTRRAEAKAAGESFLHVAMSAYIGFVRAGRSFPLWFLQGYGTFWLLGEHLVLYKVFLLAATVAASAVVYGLARQLGLSRRGAALALLIATAAMQLRTYHDGILSFAGAVQFLVIWVCGSVWLFLAWMERGGRARLVAATGCFALGCLWYELAFGFAVVFPALAIIGGRSGRGRRVRGAFAPFSVGVVFAAVAAVLRARATAPFAGYEPVLSPGPVLRTLGAQVSGALPGSVLLGPAPERVPLASLVHPSPGSLLLGVGAGVLALILLRGAGPGGQPVRRASLAVVVVAIILGPAIPIAVAGRYQRELTWGIAYIPVTMEVFGVGLLGSWLARRLTTGPSLAARAAAAAIAVAVGMAALYDHEVGRRTVALNGRVAASMEADRRALERGLLDGLADGSRVYVDRPWLLAPGFFARFADRRLEVVLTDDPHFAEDAGAGGCGGPPRERYAYQLVAEPSFPEVVAGAPEPINVELVCIGPVTSELGPSQRGF